MRESRSFLLCLATGAVFVLDAGRADACGGCFVPPSEVTVVTDHRMALSVSPQQTVLWDQIRYSGDPREFAWVLPVRAGAKIEVANDEFFTALDASSQPVVFAPQRFGGNACALTGCSSDRSDFASAGAANDDGVQILSQSVVGPYEQVTLRSTDDSALVRWLRRNDFAIPSSIEPTIDAYVGEGFDFIALKLRPECGERSMRPVRVVSRGADPTLPLRMVAAGVGARVGITLYVITEGRYAPQNFESATIDDQDLRWNRFENKSNYESLSQEIMGRGAGRTWITEYADRPQIPLTGSGWRAPNSNSSRGGRFGQSNPGLADTYFSLCKSYRAANPPPPSSAPSTSTPAFTPCPESDAGGQHQGPADAGDAGRSDAGPGDSGIDDAGIDDAGVDSGEADDDGGAGSEDDAGSDAGRDAGQDAGGDAGQDAGGPSDPYASCAYLDDLDLALAGLHRENVWVTRLRATLPVDALKAGDLRLQPALLGDGRSDPDPVSNVHFAPYFEDEDRSDGANQQSCAGGAKQRRTFGGWALAVVSGIFAASWLRRRRRPR